MYLLINLFITEEKKIGKSHCPFIDNFSLNQMSDEELMEDICKIVNESNKVNLVKCQKEKNIKKPEFITQTDIKYDALCFVKNINVAFLDNLKYIEKKYNISIYFILIKDSDTSDDTLNKLNTLIQENKNYKLEILEETPNKTDKIYNYKYLDYMKEASFVLNFDNLDKNMLESIIKLCIVSGTPFILKNDELSNVYQKYIELKWGDFYNIENYKEKIDNFMKNYHTYFDDSKI